MNETYLNVSQFLQHNNLRKRISLLEEIHKVKFLNELITIDINYLREIFNELNDKTLTLYDKKQFSLKNLKIKGSFGYNDFLKQQSFGDINIVVN